MPQAGLQGFLRHGQHIVTADIRIKPAIGDIPGKPAGFFEHFKEVLHFAGDSKLLRGQAFIRRTDLQRTCGSVTGEACGDEQVYVVRK